VASHPVGPHAPPTHPNTSPLAVLSAREVEVLRLVARGLSNAAIADQLAISPRTVKAHVSNLLGKLDLPNRASATRLAVEWGLG
jgi:DNA-binding NarL/FixJ family response regulator